MLKASIMFNLENGQGSPFDHQLNLMSFMILAGILYWEKPKSHIR